MKRILSLCALCIGLNTSAQELQIKRGGQTDTVYQAKHILVGLVDPSAAVSINGNPVHVYKTGSWGGEVQLTEGVNSIEVTSSKGEKKELSIYYTPNRPASAQQENLSAQFTPTGLEVITKEGAYLNYGAGTDRLGGAKINFLSEGIALIAEAENESLYKVRLSDNRYAYIPKAMVDVTRRITPPANFVEANSVLSSSFSIVNTGEADRVNISLPKRKPYIIKEYAEPHKLVIDLFGVQCNTNWITHKQGLEVVKHVDVESMDTDVTRVIIYLKSHTSWGYSARYQGNSLAIEIKHTPEKLTLKGMTIGLDAGHGGKYSGAVSNAGLKEKDVNLWMVETLKDLLEKEGAKVVLTRSEDVDVPMAERRNILIGEKVDLALSIHCNAGGSPLTTGGTSTYYRHHVYQPLASMIRSRMLELEGIKDFGLVGNFNFSLVAPTEYPCVLVEVLFMSNLWDEEHLYDADYRLLMMKKVVTGLKDYLKHCQALEK